MHSFTLSKEFVDRFVKYRASKEYREIPSFSKSEYWQYHSQLIKVEVNGNTVTVGGLSGYYIPPSKEAVTQGFNKMKNILKSRENLMALIQRKKKAATSVRYKLLSYPEAFDAVMSHDPIADIVLSRDRINFLKLKENERVISSMEEMERRFFVKEKFKLNPQMIISYYLYNIICGYTNPQALKTIMEIGAGNGNLVALLYHEFKSKIVIVDIPETICLSTLFIADLFPQAQIVMPNEVNANKKDWDFLFLTPAQIHLIQDKSVDLAINIGSFMEMTHRQIQEYLSLIQRVCKNSGFFLTQNRVEKIPTDADTANILTQEVVNRFSEYPWNPSNETVVYEICRLRRLVQLDDIFMRLEKIKNA